jgi:ubiquinone/menaquinone biosynthesis C-methylase UbiE
MLAPKFDLTPFRTPDELLEAAIHCAGEVDSALDLCCGTGVAMAAMAPYTKKRLVGIDFSPGMLAQAQLRMDRIQIKPTVELVEADVFAMSFVEEFDLAVCFGALGHILPSREREFIRKVRSALKPGGVFLFVTGSHPPVYSPVALIFRVFNGIMKVRNRLRKPEFIMYYFTFLLPEIRSLLEEEGFQVDIYKGLFPEPFQRASLVMARKAESANPTEDV